MKINALSIQQQEYKFEQDLNYEEWLKDNNSEPTSNELNDMEKSTILKRSFHHPINSLDYQPLKGA